MTITDQETWTIAEMAGTPGNMKGSVDYNPVGNSGFNAGFGVGGGDVLKMGLFRADFSIQNNGPISNFGLMSYSGMVPRVQLQAIPEPATMLLLALGSIGLLKKKR